MAVEAIEKLPHVIRGVCRDCLSYEWTAANFDEDAQEFYQCNMCHYFDVHEKKLKVKEELKN